MAVVRYAKTGSNVEGQGTHTIPEKQRQIFAEPDGRVGAVCYTEWFCSQQQQPQQQQQQQQQQDSLVDSSLVQKKLQQQRSVPSEPLLARPIDYD